MGRKTIPTKGGKSTPATADELRWSVERRLAFIEQRLFWRGVINRNDLMRRYGVSTSQASGDINRYLALNPGGIVYDKSAKRYEADDTFRPVLDPPDAARLLGELRLVDIGVLPEEETLLGVTPPFDAAPVPERPVEPRVLRAVWRAIEGSRAVDCFYQSMSRPEPARRLIEPHALAHDGFRWHARAFDRETDQFRDFVLGRIAKPKPDGSRRKGAEEDAAWNEWVELRIAPHPELTPAQASAIRLDYGIEGDWASLSVRRALLFYALKRLGLDTAPEARPPSEQHIVLVNREAVMAKLAGPEEV